MAKRGSTWQTKGVTLVTYSCRRLVLNRRRLTTGSRRAKKIISDAITNPRIESKKSIGILNKHIYTISNSKHHSSSCLFLSDKHIRQAVNSFSRAVYIFFRGSTGNRNRKGDRKIRLDIVCSLCKQALILGLFGGVTNHGKSSLKQHHFR